MIDAGYRIYPNLYKFEEYGIPQKSHRVIIVGIRNDLPYDFHIPSIETCFLAIFMIFYYTCVNCGATSSETVRSNEVHTRV